MLKLTQEKPVKPYVLAREVIHPQIVRARKLTPHRWIDERVHIVRLGNKLKDLLGHAELSLFYKDYPDYPNVPGVDVDDLVAGYCRTEEEKRQEALKIIWDLIAEMYETDSKGEVRSEYELRRLVEELAAL
jgi:hypothetical protein